MKIQFEVLKSELDVLDSIKRAQMLLKETVGPLPQSWPSRGGEVERCCELLQNMEHVWKRWVIDRFIRESEPFAELMKDTELARAGEYLHEEDL